VRAPWCDGLRVQRPERRLCTDAVSWTSWYLTEEESAIDTFRRVLIVVALACATVLIGVGSIGCSGTSDENGTDSESASETSVDSTSSEESTAGPQARVAVFFVDGDVVVPAMREVAAGDLDAVAAALFAGPTETDRGALGSQLTSEIPAEAEFASVSRDGGQVTIDVTEPFITDGGSLGMKLRLAQLTYTLTALQDVDEVLLKSGEDTVRLVGEGLEIENPLTREQYTGVTPEVLIESPLPGDEVGSPMTVSGTTALPGAEFILRLTDSRDTVITERLVQSDSETGLFGVEVEYDGAEPGQGVLYALSLEEDLLMGVMIGLR